MRRGEIAHTVSRGAFYLTLEKAAALFSGVAYFALLLRWLGPTKYGIMTLALSFAGLATMMNGNFEVFLERYAAEYQAHGRLRTLRRAQFHAMGLKLALGAVASLVLVLGAPFIAVQFHTPELSYLLPMLSLMVLLEGFASTGRATLYGLQQFRWMSVVALAFHIAKTIMVGLLWWLKQGLPALAIGLTTLAVLQGAVSAAIPMWMLRRARDPEGAPPGLSGKPLTRAILGYCLPLLGARVTFLSGQNLGKIVLGKLFDTTLLGFFSFAYQTVERFVEMIFAIPSSLLPSLTHLVAREERDRLRFVFDQSLRIIQVVALVLSCGMAVFAREITLVIGSPLFEPAIPMLRIMALVPIARTAQQPLTMLFQALRLPGTVLVLAIIKFVTEFGCYFALVPTVGIAGAAWANLAGAIVSYIVAMILLDQLVPEGRDERTRTTWLGLACFAPFLLLGLVIGDHFGHLGSTLARLALVPPTLALTLAVGLVRPADFERLSSFPLESTWMRRTRDLVVAAAQRTANALVPRRLL
ncbi:MAG TPA: oligosaccharide flippase family protein [Candidatus Sulfotelmatobacter sp.]|nr:oligosaccharide flippase family protein [Candidatus Sulfotelmatobacter sp.]